MIGTNCRRATNLFHQALHQSHPVPLVGSKFSKTYTVVRENQSGFIA